jgi:hypothetical protein
MSENERNALRIPDRDHNPFMIRNEKFFFLYVILDFDSSLLRHLIPSLYHSYGSDSFTRLQATAELGTSLYELSEELTAFRSHQAFAERRMISKQIEQLDRENKAAKNGKRPLTGIMRISPRLETLVDLGLISTMDKFTYTYIISSSVAKKFAELPRFDTINEFLACSFFSFACSIFNLEAEQEQDKDFVFNAAKNAYIMLGGRGYKSIRDLSMMASIISIEKYNKYVEIKDLVEVLENLRRRGSKEVILSGGRKVGGPQYVMLRGR